VKKNLKIVITDYIKQPNIENDVLGNNVDIICLCEDNEKDFSDIIEDADILMVWHAEITKYTINRLEKCKAIMRIGTGFDNVDIGFARKCGIPVTNVPDYGTHEVADTTCSMILDLARGLSMYNHLSKNYKFGWQENFIPELKRLENHNLGIIGMGRIGTAVGLRMKAFNIDVAFYDPYISDGYEKSLGVKRFRSLAELFSFASIMSIHTPLTEETISMVNKDFIELMNPGSILINTARGQIVESLSVIYDALNSGKLAGVGLDVLPEEPPSEKEPLIKTWKNPVDPLCSRILISPHTAFYSKTAWHEMRFKAAENASRVLSGQDPINIINN
jgi:C-terminal binding protein